MHQRIRVCPLANHLDTPHQRMQQLSCIVPASWVTQAMHAVSPKPSQLLLLVTVACIGFGSAAGIAKINQQSGVHTNEPSSRWLERLAKAVGAGVKLARQGNWGFLNQYETLMRLGAQVAGARTCRQSSPDLTMMGRTAQPGRRPCGDCACTRRALSAKRSPYTARACAAAASASVAAADSAACAAPPAA